MFKLCLNGSFTLNLSSEYSESIAYVHILFELSYISNQVHDFFRNGTCSTLVARG